MFVHGVRTAGEPRRARPGRRGRTCGCAPRSGWARPRTARPPPRAAGPPAASRRPPRTRARAAGARGGARRTRCRRCGRPAAPRPRPRRRRAIGVPNAGAIEARSATVPGDKVDGRHPVTVAGQPRERNPKQHPSSTTEPRRQRRRRGRARGPCPRWSRRARRRGPARGGCCGRRGARLADHRHEGALERVRWDEARGDEVVGDPPGEVVAELGRRDAVAQLPVGVERQAGGARHLRSVGMVPVRARLSGRAGAGSSDRVGWCRSATVDGPGEDAGRVLGMAGFAVRIDDLRGAAAAFARLRADAEGLLAANGLGDQRWDGGPRSRAGRLAGALRRGGRRGVGGGHHRGRHAGAIATKLGGTADSYLVAEHDATGARAAAQRPRPAGREGPPAHPAAQAAAQRRRRRSADRRRRRARTRTDARRTSGAASQAGRAPRPAVEHGRGRAGGARRPGRATTPAATPSGCARRGRGGSRWRRG